MNSIQIDDLAPEEIGVVEIVDNDELDLIVGAKNYGTGFVCSATGGTSSKDLDPNEECHRV